MTVNPDQMDRENLEDGRHDFRSATASADDDQMEDERGHAFVHGRVAERDEEDEQQ